METKQINLKLPKNLIEAAERYVKSHGYKNVQELASESIREKVFEEGEYDESFNQKEIELIDELVELSIKRGEVVSEEELNGILNGV
ncbi:hypothetical protein HYV49_04230 [Candidatus Pacearchaeota archaeon]|nr:hypothetical protein [Candidatus Pacearchaeota archaeon]